MLCLWTLGNMIIHVSNTNPRSSSKGHTQNIELFLEAWSCVQWWRLGIPPPNRRRGGCKNAPLPWGTIFISSTHFTLFFKNLRVREQIKPVMVAQNCTHSIKALQLTLLLFVACMWYLPSSSSSLSTSSNHSSSSLSS